MKYKNLNKKKESVMFRKTLELILESHIQGRNAHIMCMALDLPDEPDSCVL